MRNQFILAGALALHLSAGVSAQAPTASPDSSAWPCPCAGDSTIRGAGGDPAARAGELYESALAGRPMAARDWDAIAGALLDAGRLREAISASERALQLATPDVRDAALRIAEAYARLGDARQARRWTELAELMVEWKAGATWIARSSRIA